MLRCVIIFLVFIISGIWCCVGNGSRVAPAIIPIGVVLDLNSPLAAMAELCLETAVADFYAAHPNQTTRLHLHKKTAPTLLDANLAALELLDHEEVQGIIGAHGSIDEVVFAELGEKFHVPVISLLSRSSPIYSSHYFVRIAPDDALQAQALAAICKTFQWSEVAMLYEDTDYGYQFLSYMSTTLEEVEIRLAFTIPIPSSANNSDILKRLSKITMKQTRIFLVHVNHDLGLQLFNLAKKEGLMSKGYAWLITNSVSIFINSMDSATHDSMEGVIGVRPYINHSKEVTSFHERYNRNAFLKNKTSSIMELNIYGLWAHDVVTTLATAVEKIMSMNLTSYDVSMITNGLNKTSLRNSKFGTILLNELSNIRFTGLSGYFKLVNGEMKPSRFEIFNVFGSGEKTIGYWTSDKGILREWGSTGETKGLKNVMWPGDSIMQPKGYDVPRNLRVGIPDRHGFFEFVGVHFNSGTQNYYPTGFSIDIFHAALDILPFPIDYKFCFFDTKYVNWSYDDMLRKIPQDFDMVVGDTTIWAPRASIVDFSTPYSESGVALVVKNKKPFDMWIFVKPLSWDLWVAIVVVCILMGVVLRILESKMTSNEVDSIRMHNEQPGTIYWSPVAILAFPERNMVSNKWSFFVLVFWMFMAFILMQSYTANLSAILTVDRLKFAFSDNYYVGFPEGSFMKSFLTKQINISESRLRNYTSAEEYHIAMSLGSKNGGIDAIFDEVPYMKIFLNKYDSQYKMVGPTYRTGGFGFAFPMSSPLVRHFSNAILDITQGSNITALEQKNFGPGYSSQDPLSSTISQHTSSLTLFHFGGLFIIIGSVMISALLFSETTIGQKLTKKTEHLLHNFFHAFKTLKDNFVLDRASDDGDSAELSEEDNHQQAQNDSIASSVEEDTNADVVGQATQHGSVNGIE